MGGASLTLGSPFLTEHGRMCQRVGLAASPSRISLAIPVGQALSPNSNRVFHFHAVRTSGTYFRVA